MRACFVLACATCGSILLGCQLYNPVGVRLDPETKAEDAGPSVEEVFAATREVMLERYGFVSPIQRSAVVMAVTPVELYGLSKSRKQITVQVKKTYIGSWEPIVRVVRFVEVEEPNLAAQPEAADPALAVPIATHTWRALHTMPVEEQAIYADIVGRLVGAHTES